MAFETEILLLIVASSLVIYLMATQSQEYVPIRERPKRRTFGRNVINYYGWKGPFFIDDFAKFEEDAKAVIDRRKRVPLGKEPTAPKDFSGTSAAGNAPVSTPSLAAGIVEGFGTFKPPENSLNEVVPVWRENGCVLPKYNTKNVDAIKCHKKAMLKCRVPFHTAEDGWRNEYHPDTYKMRGPSDEGELCRPPNPFNGDPGNFRQTTNNTLDVANNIKCNARSRYMDYCDPLERVSQYCYAKTYSDCVGKPTHQT